MTEETYQMADASDKKKNPILWIILGILAVIVICCCCLIIMGAMIFGIVNLTAESNFYFSPLLGLI